MNTYLLGLLSKWVTILTVSVTGLFNSNFFASEEKYEVNNSNQTKNSAAGVTEVAYETTTTYTDKLPKGTTVTKQEGKLGLAYVDENNNTIEVIQEKQNAIIEVGTGETTSYVGKLTGYGADCVGCTGSGNLSCKTKNGKTWSLVRDGATYKDDDYGQVRILAAALKKFPCGTIVEVVSPKLGTFDAVVLDTGGSMRTAWENGVVHMDLAFVSQKTGEVHQATGTNIKFNVKRWGW